MVVVRVFEPGEAPPELYRFRYSVYVEEMRRRQKYASHVDRTIIDPLDDTAVNVVAFDNDAVCGCVRVNILRRGSIGDYLSIYEIDRLPSAAQWATSITTRLMVARAWRRTLVTAKLITTVYDYALRREVLTDYIDCNHHLIPFFAKLGYRKNFEKTHPEYGDVAVMSIKVRDAAHLESMGSPFLPMLINWIKEEGRAARTEVFESA